MAKCHCLHTQGVVAFQLPGLTHQIELRGSALLIPLPNIVALRVNAGPPRDPDLEAARRKILLQYNLLIGTCLRFKYPLTHDSPRCPLRLLTPQDLPPSSRGFRRRYTYFTQHLLYFLHVGSLLYRSLGLFDKK